MYGIENGLECTYGYFVLRMQSSFPIISSSAASYQIYPGSEGEIVRYAATYLDAV